MGSNRAVLFLLLLGSVSLSFQAEHPKQKSNITISLRRILVSIVLGVTSGLAGALIFLYILRFLFLYINRTPLRKGPVIFSLKTPPAALLSAVENDAVLLRSTYLKVSLDNNLTLAVKKLRPVEQHLNRRLQRELETLAALRHTNLMTLHAFISTPESLSIIYDYMPNGSLEEAMAKVRENHFHLGWDMRLQIAIGIIKCLRFLHFECSPRILHHNLKPSNILLDEELQPKLGDCGLSLFERDPSPYTAPEFIHSKRYTEKSEVYSFGMILAVLVTGRDPGEAVFKEGGGLGNWVRQLQVEGEGREAIDRKIVAGEEEDEVEEMHMALRIAVVCVSELPADRPCTDELVPMLSLLHSF